MSAETTTWLNTNVLVGMTDQRGNAWHYNEAAQGAEPNHYPAGIPVDDVLRRLFSWEAIELPLHINLAAGVDDADSIDANGQATRRVEVAGRKAIADPETGHVFGIFTDSYKVHQFQTWLVENVATLLDDSGLVIGGAGLLKRKALAYVQIELTENMVSKSGIAFRPRLTATTAHDGTIPTTYKRMRQVIVCDNTYAAGMKEDSPEFKIRHTSRSLTRIASAREALELIVDDGEQFAAEIDALCERKVTDRQFAKVLDRLLPVVKDAGKATTINTAKRAGIVSLWDGNDPRVAPFKNTAFGVVQAFNTYRHHFLNVKGTSRQERNLLNGIDGTTGKADAEVLAVLVAAGVK